MEELAKHINEKIKGSKEYKNYAFYKEQIENNIQLQEIKDKMNFLKEQICKNRSEELLKEYYSLEFKYKESAIVKEYLHSKETLEELLRNISDILSLN